jgi:hypothetical protein
MSLRPNGKTLLPQGEYSLNLVSVIPKMLAEISVSLKYYKNNCDFCVDLCIFMKIFRRLFLKIRNISEELRGGNS